MSLIFQVTSQDQAIEVSCDVVKENSSFYVTSLPRLVIMGFFVVKIKCF